MRRPCATSRTVQERRDTASEKKEERAARTPEQQLQLLDHRLGENTGAMRERERLAMIISERSSAKSTDKRNKSEKRKKK